MQSRMGPGSEAPVLRCVRSPRRNCFVVMAQTNLTPALAHRRPALGRLQAHDNDYFAARIGEEVARPVQLETAPRADACETPSLPGRSDAIGNLAVRIRPNSKLEGPDRALDDRDAHPSLFKRRLKRHRCRWQVVRIVKWNNW